MEVLCFLLVAKFAAGKNRSFVLNRNWCFGRVLAGDVRPGVRGRRYCSVVCDVRHFHRFIILLRRAKCKTLCVYIGWHFGRSPKGWRTEGRRYKTCAYAFALVRSSTYVFTVSNAVALFEKRCGPKWDSSSFSSASHSACVAHSNATPCSLFGASVGVAQKSEQLIPRSPGSIFQTS